MEGSSVPPSWDGAELLVPGWRHIRVRATPRTTIEVIRDFFDCNRAAKVDRDAWTLHITAFVDYEPVTFKVEVYCNPNSEAHTDMIFHHIQQDNSVQFRNVCSTAIDHLSMSSLQVLEPERARSFISRVVDEEFYDDLCEFEEDWPAMFASMLKAADSPAASLREAGLQALARWAERRRDCVPALTDALLVHSELVGRLLQGPLAECYPLAVTLRVAFACPRGAERLGCQILPLIPWPQTGMPSIVAHELEEAFLNLTASVLANRRAGKASKRVNRAEFSCVSTYAPSTSSLHEFSELEESELEEEVARDWLFEDT